MLKPLLRQKKKSRKISYPVDERKIKVAITTEKMAKPSKASSDTSWFPEKVIDHLAEMTYSLSDGPTVRYNMDEFTLPWDQIRSIEFAKKKQGKRRDKLCRSFRHFSGSLSNASCRTNTTH